MNGRKKQEKDIVPTIRMNGRNFFSPNSPVQDSEWAETAIPYDDEGMHQDPLFEDNGDWQAQHFL